jgi:hypothetical protein
MGELVGEKLGAATSVAVMARLKLPLREPSVLDVDKAAGRVARAHQRSSEDRRPRLAVEVRHRAGGEDVGGLAEADVKSAPEPTVTAAARPIVPRPSSRVRGEDRHKAEMRFIGGSWDDWQMRATRTGR